MKHVSNREIARVLNEKAAFNIESLAGPNANISSTAGR